VRVMILSEFCTAQLTHFSNDNAVLLVVRFSLDYERIMTFLRLSSWSSATRCAATGSGSGYPPPRYETIITQLSPLITTH